MSDKKPNPASDDAEVVLAALKNMGSGNYATLAKATGLSKIAVSSAITDLRKRGLVNSESGGKYSAANGKTPTQPADKPIDSAGTEEPPPPPPPPPPKSKKKPRRSKPAGGAGEDAEVVLAALNNMGSGNYAMLAIATGLSKIAVSSAITDLRKRGLVNSESGGKYSPANGTGTTEATDKPKAATTKASPAVSEGKPKPAGAPAAGKDAEVVLAALKGLGSSNYAALARATGLSKIAVSSAITDLRKRGLVNNEPGGVYSVTGDTPGTSGEVPPTGSLATDLERLAALRESGALTAAEFSKAKKKLLDTN